jgi:hypothetical protein
MKYTKKDIQALFTYHSPINIDVSRFERIREDARRLGETIIACSEPNIDQERSIQKLRDCVYLAIASIVVPKVGE